MAETDFNIQGYSIGEIHSEPPSVTAQGAPDYPLLIVPIKLTIEDLESVREVPQCVILSVQSQLYIGSSSNKIADSTPIFEPVEFVRNNKARANYRVEFPLDFHRIKLIEEKRRGNMIFNISFSLLIGYYPSLLLQKEQYQNTDRALTHYETFSSRQLTLDIPQSYWVEKVLPLLGLGEYFIIEMPKGKKTLQEAWGYLEKAEFGYRSWNSKEVFGNCREIGTLLDGYIKAKFGTKTFSYEERWVRAFGSFKHLASLDLHLEDVKKKLVYPEESVKTNKSDAEHPLIRARALIKYAEELIQE